MGKREVFLAGGSHIPVILTGFTSILKTRNTKRKHSDEYKELLNRFQVEHDDRYCLIFMIENDVTLMMSDLEMSPLLCHLFGAGVCRKSGFYKCNTPFKQASPVDVFL